MDISERIVVHTTFEIDRIKHPDLVSVVFKHRSTFGENGALRIGDDIT